MIVEAISIIRNELSSFASNSKVWVFYSVKPFSSSLQSSITDFINQWKSHGDKVEAKGYIIDQHIVLIVADYHYSSVSGCSTDSLVRFIQQLGLQESINFFDRELVVYLDKQSIHITTIDKLIELDNDTLIFNPFFINLEDWRENFVQKIQESKYKRFVKKDRA